MRGRVESQQEEELLHVKSGPVFRDEVNQVTDVVIEKDQISDLRPSVLGPANYGRHT